jgi:hypothetical protein
MAAPKVFFVHLRRPRSSDPRTDPLYEFGSFGCTKCHCSNLFHPRHADELEGSRLAFVQGGDHGSRLVFLTPPITVKVWPGNCEARWTPPEMPFKYSEAPVLVANDGSSNFPLVAQFARTAKCPSLESSLSSRLRSRSSALPADLAAQVVSVYERCRKASGPSAIASSYSEALPYVTRIDGDRGATYQRLIRGLEAEVRGAGGVVSGKVVAPQPQKLPRCGSSQRRQSRGPTSRCRR